MLALKSWTNPNKPPNLVTLVVRKDTLTMHFGACK